MTYTDDEKALAKSLTDDPAIMALLRKVFVEDREELNPDLALSKPNTELGELVKADLLANQKVANRLSTLKRLATGTQRPNAPIAPA